MDLEVTNPVDGQQFYFMVLFDVLGVSHELRSSTVTVTVTQKSGKYLNRLT